MVDPKLAMIAAALALSAAPALAQDDPGAACDHCAVSQTDLPPAADAAPASRFESERRVYVTRSESVTRASYSEGYLSWPGKDSGGEGARFEPQYDHQSMPCPPVRPGERVVSCRYVPFAQQADIAPMGGVLYADGGVGPEYISGGGGGGGATIIEGGANASASSSASASAVASANVSVLINEHMNHRPPKGGYTPPPPSGGGWPPGSMTPPSGGSWGPGSMTGGGSWPSGSMASGGRYGSWPSGGMGSGGVGAGHGVTHSVGHPASHGGHGRR